jgi:hypothetical protein
MRRIAISLSIALLLSFGLAAADSDSDASVRLHELFDREWEWRLEQNPTCPSASSTSLSRAIAPGSPVRVALASA